MALKLFVLMLIFGMAVSMSSSTNAATFTKMSEVLTSGTVILAQTPGMERRQDRRAARQDCRQQNGLVGQAKRNCKQGARQQQQ